MQKITPNLWFDGDAEEAVDRYTSIFDDSSIGATSRYDEASAAASGQPEGSVMTVEFKLEGQSFLALNGGPSSSSTRRSRSSSTALPGRKSTNSGQRCRRVASR